MNKCDMPTLQRIVRGVWHGTLLPGRCYVRFVRGAYRAVALVHHGKGFDLEDYDPDLSAAFIRACRNTLGLAQPCDREVVFQLENPHGLARAYPFARSALERILLHAYVHADRLPRAEWEALPRDGWQGVFYNGDRIEMWERYVERRGRLYRVREGWWNSIQPSAAYHEEISYIGARRGAMLSAGYRPDSGRSV